MSIGKVTKTFSYSPNAFHVSPSSLEGGAGQIYNWIIGVNYFKWALFVWIYNAKKVPFYLENCIW